MKFITTSIFALILSTPVVLADGCGNHGKDVTMSCAVGQVWNPETQQCMDTNAQNLPEVCSFSIGGGQAANRLYTLATCTCCY